MTAQNTPQEAEESIGPGPAGARTRPRRALLAEDDEEMCRLLADTLRDDGFDVIESANGIELLDTIGELRSVVRNGRFFDVDVIISDIRMPWASGLEVLQELRATDSTTPVILITAFGDEETHAQACRLGAAEVLDKPFDLDQFLAMVRRHAPE